MADSADADDDVEDVDADPDVSDTAGGRPATAGDGVPPGCTTPGNPAAMRPTIPASAGSTSAGWNGLFGPSSPDWSTRWRSSWAAVRTGQEIVAWSGTDEAYEGHLATGVADTPPEPPR
jgi:hypothetical protein